MSEQETQAQVDQQTKLYVYLRDKKKLIDDEYNEKKKVVTDKMDQLEGLLQAFLETHGLQSLKTKFGTVYLSTKTTASLADPEAFMDFIVANELFELLDRRANSTACKEYAEEHKALPPGLNLNSYTSVGVRRA